MENTKRIEIDARDGNYTGLMLSAAQQKTLDSIRSAIPRFDFYGAPDRYEVKEFTVSQILPDPEDVAFFRSAGIRVQSPPVYLYMVTGMVDDGGTLAEVYCRKIRHLKIGPRGGIESNSTARSAGFRPVSLFDAMNKEYRN